MDKILDSDKNDNLHLLSSNDLLDLLFEAVNLQLEYRDKIDLPNYVTFGCELEYEGSNESRINSFICNEYPKWICKRDSSLSSGGEISSPILCDSKRSWKELKSICNYLKKKGVDTSHNAGGHIHIGSSILTNDIEKWKTFFKIYINYESVLFRFLYGDKINGRPKIIKYANPTADMLYDNWDNIENITRLYNLKNSVRQNNKYHALNLRNVDFYDTKYHSSKNTIEFRSPNASVNEVIWQNNINTITKMLLSARNQVVSEEFLDYKMEHEFIPYRENPYQYSVINIKNALEFVDLIFDNNLDKLYFLSQYLKNFQEIYSDIDSCVNAKTFIK